ncbi:MAG: alpha/beta hydrolase [Actinomycetota bacterium]
MPVAEVNGQSINYADSGGDGPVILWSHGFLMDHTMFDAQVQALSGDYRCIAWDERGFGETPATAPFTYWDMADDALALLDHLGVEQAVLAGMSQGGFISMRAALSRPDRVRGLILIDTQAGTEAEENIEAYGGMLQHWLSDAPLGEIGDFVAGLILGDPELSATWIPIWEARRSEMNEHPGTCLLSRDDITDRLGEIACPALVIHGDADAAIPLDLGQVLADRIPTASIEVMPGGSHAANMTHPAETNQAIAAFMAGLS